MTGAGLAAEIHLSSRYLKGADGTRLAVDVWRHQDADAATPAILLSTRYWRSFALRDDRPELQGSFPLAAYYCRRGFTVVNLDSRGSGASFGTRTSEWSEEEVDDLTAVIDWVADQPWCDGRVLTHGFSYGGNTAFLAAVGGHPALCGMAPQFADFDIYRHNLYPGGLTNQWLRSHWGKLTSAMDKGDTAAMSELLPGVDAEAFRQQVLGPRPVDGDAGAGLLAQAVAEHCGNFNMAACDPSLDCIDDGTDGRRAGGPDSTFDCERLSLYQHRRAIETAAVPIVYWAGWFDAGTAAGALELFASFNNPMHIFIGPWNHGRTCLQDPFADSEWPEPIDLQTNFDDVHSGFQRCLDGVVEQRVLHYFTLGERRWKETRQWPPANSGKLVLYPGNGGSLSQQLPREWQGADPLDPGAPHTTGIHNRWHTQIGCRPVQHQDRRDAMGALPVYETEPLEQDLEITGYPVVHVYLASERRDLALFAYLEIVTPEGRVRLLTEGCLRAAHRRVVEGDESPVGFGPQHSFRRADLLWLRPDEPTELAFAMLPISVVIPAGFRLRLAFAGMDRDTFGPLACTGNGSAAILRNRYQPTRVELPIIHR